MQVMINSKDIVWNVYV